VGLNQTAKATCVAIDCPRTSDPSLSVFNRFGGYVVMKTYGLVGVWNTYFDPEVFEQRKIYIVVPPKVAKSKVGQLLLDVKHKHRAVASTYVFAALGFEERRKTVFHARLVTMPVTPIKNETHHSL
jgi:hypothetical protein